MVFGRIRAGSRIIGAFSQAISNQPPRVDSARAGKVMDGTDRQFITATRPAGLLSVGGTPPAFTRVTPIVIVTMLPSLSCS